MARISGSASEEIEAPLEAVWEVVADVASAPEWQDGMIAMHVFDTDEEGRATLVETESDAKVKTVKAKIRFSYHPPTRLAWAQEEGDLKSLDGSWVLEDLGGQRTRATYAIDGDPGRTLGMLIRGPVEGKIRDLLVNGRPGELKRRVEKGG